MLRPNPGVPKPKVDFDAVPAPANYVSGLGRGATGFTTRSDIGPARMAPEFGGPSAPGAPAGDKKDDDEKPKGEEPQEFDEMMGNDAGIFSVNSYDDDDKEADDIWDAVDAHMDERRRERREARLKKQIEEYRASNPKITEQFADLKRQLGQVSEEEWDSIPEIGDYTIKNKKRFESFIPVPDTLLAKAIAEKETVSAIDPSAKLVGGFDTPMGLQSTTTDLTALGAGREKMLSLKLDRMADSVSGQTVVDPKGYMTDLKSMKISSEAEISDIKRARLLLKSVIQSNPTHAPGWIAAARLEELAGKLAAARMFVQKGCEQCPKSEDVWLEAVRLSNPDNAKAMLARGVNEIPTSVNLWLQAAKLEHEPDKKQRVLRKALEQIPNSVKLWKAAVELATEEDARTLLSRAVECCPQHTELWLALTRLETYENARKVLNRARETIPTDPAIWMTAAKLEETHGNEVMMIIERAVKALRKNNVVITHEEWLKEAESAEKSEHPKTCEAIVVSTIGLGVEDQDRKRTWMADAEDCQKRASIHTARAIYAHALSVFPGKKSIWLRAAQLEKASGTRESLDSLLIRAVKYCPQAEILWLMGAKEKWLAGDVEAARTILQEAWAANPDSEEVWLAAFKLEFENHEPERARLILQKAREKGGTARMWMKSAVVERELGNVEQQRSLLQNGLSKHPTAWKLWLMLGQLETQEGQLQRAREAYTTALRQCPACVPLWTAAAALEEAAGNPSKARALLEQARLKNPKEAEVWLAAVRTEQLCSGATSSAAAALMARALQACPSSGILWAEAVSMAPRPQRKAKSVDALKRCDNDPHVIHAVANLFWADRKIEKARSWFNRCVTLEPDVGDFWARFYKLECQHGTPEQQQDVVQRCIQAAPKHGEKWCQVSKNPANAHDQVDVLLKKVLIAMEKAEQAAAQ